MVSVTKTAMSSLSSITRIRSLVSSVSISSGSFRAPHWLGLLWHCAPRRPAAHGVDVPPLISGRERKQGVAIEHAGRANSISIAVARQLSHLIGLFLGETGAGGQDADRSEEHTSELQ